MEHIIFQEMRHLQKGLLQRDVDLMRAIPSLLRMKLYKGCGICASVCPKGAIQMVLEEGI